MKKNSGSDFILDGDESLKVYMKALQRYPLLTKDQEIELAKIIRDSKNEILKLCVNSKECLEQICSLKDSGITELRKFFFSSIEEDTTREQVQDMAKKLELLVLNKIKGKKNSDVKLLKFLSEMTFTLKDLQKLTNPLKTGTKIKTDKFSKKFQYLIDSKNKLAEGNLRLVFSRVKLFLNKGLSFEDLIQEGNIGLMKSIEKFDVDKGIKFGTYATWWIDQALSRSVADKGRLIRVPVYVVENINKINKVSTKLNQDLGREPTIDEITAKVDISKEKVQKAKKVVSFPQSLEEPNKESGIPLSEYLIDYDTPDPYEALERKEIAEKIRQLISRLDPRDEKILRMRFGIGEKQPKTLKTIGNHFGLTKERIRQIVGESLDKLGKINSREGVYNDRVNLSRSQKITASKSQKRFIF